MNVVATLLLLYSLQWAHAEWPSEPAPTPSFDKIEKYLHGPINKYCSLLDKDASDYHLPVAYFTRLIWQESHFDVGAQSPAGAQGIAQFMPGTAGARGLLNPFDPITALRESAAYLSELRTTFGNLGLAAMAYNAGAYRITLWLAHQGGLPYETEQYVQIVTGHTAEEWTSADAVKLEGDFPDGISCVQIAGMLSDRTGQATSGAKLPPNPEWKPWGVILVGAWNQGAVLAGFERLRRQYPGIIADHRPLILHVRPTFARALQYSVRIAFDGLKEAKAFCSRLEAAGGACDVLRNPR